MNHICIAHAHDRQIGYGRMGVDLSKALIDMGLNVSDWTEGWEAHIPPADSVHTPGRARTVVFVSPGTHVQGWFEGQYTVAYTMWEATELPEANRDTLHEYDLIVVPSEENLKLYSRYHPNVKMVPLGVGPEWHYRPRDPLSYELDMDLNISGEEILTYRWTDGTHSSYREVRTEGMSLAHDVGMPMSSPAFNFLCAGAGPLRKGIDLVAKAFQLAFPQAQFMQPRPELIYKSPLGMEVEGTTQNIPGYLSEAEELDLYQSAHCFVSASRGEGFGLQPLQAIAQGCPTILVDAHGHESFAGLASRTVRAKLVPAPVQMGSGEIEGEAGEWWECDVEDLAAAMDQVYSDYAMFVEKARWASQHAHAEFSWARTAQGLVDAIGEQFLEEMLPHNPTKGHPSSIWHALTHKKYLVRVTDSYRGVVNSVAYNLEPGQDYYEVADIKRQIARMGLLHPSCIDDDGVVKVDPRFSGSHAYCPTCKQRLNSVPSKADDILASLET